MCVDHAKECCSMEEHSFGITDGSFSPAIETEKNYAHTQKNRSNLWKFPSFGVHLFIRSQILFTKFVQKKKNERNIFCIRLCFYYYFYRGLFIWKTNICTLTQFSQPVQIKEVETDITYRLFIFFSRWIAIFLGFICVWWNKQQQQKQNNTKQK